MKNNRNEFACNNIEKKKEITERSMNNMDKKTKNIIKAGVAAAAVITTGLIIGTAPAYAEENCACAADSHAEACKCGCADMREEAENAQKEYDAAGEASAKAANEKMSAGTELQNAKSEYSDAKAQLEKEIADYKKAAKADEEEALKKVNEASAEHKSLEGEEAKAAADEDKSKEIADTARKIESGEVTLEETPEYKAVLDDEEKLEELSADKEALGKKISGSEKKAADYREKADSLSKSAADKESAMAQRQEIIDKSTADRETVLKEYDDLKKEVDSLKSEEKKLKESVTEGSQRKEQSAAERDAAAQAYEKAASDSKVKKEAMDNAGKSLDEYNQNAEKKRNSADLFRWLLTRDDLSASLRKSAEVAVRALTNTPDANDRFGGTVSYDEIMKATSLGDKDDATHLDNVKYAVDFIEEGNGCRDKENAGLEPLVITPRLMAFAELNANYMNKNSVLMHTGAFPASENAASGFGFFYMWYDMEKAIYEEKGEAAVWDEVGHYKTLVSPHINLTGFGYNGYYASHTFYVGAEEDGYTIEEFRALIKEYEGFLESEKERLQKTFAKTQKEYDMAQGRLGNALSEKQKADDRFKNAGNILSDLLSKQKQNADALVKGEQSLEKYAIVLDETGEKLKKVIGEKEDLKKELGIIKAELEEVKASYDAEMRALTIDKEKYEKLSSEHASAQNKLKEDREALSLIQDIDAALKNYELKKEEHRLVKESLQKAAGRLEGARREYEDKKKASEKARKLSFEEAKSSDDEAYAPFAEAIEAVSISESKYLEAVKKFDKSVETLKKAEEELVAKKAILDKAISAEKALKKLCEGHIKTDGGSATPTDSSGGSRKVHYNGDAVSVASVKAPRASHTQAASAGDTGGLPIWIAVSAISISAMGLAVVFRKKKTD